MSDKDAFLLLRKAGITVAASTRKTRCTHVVIRYREDMLHAARVLLHVLDWQHLRLHRAKTVARGFLVWPVIPVAIRKNRALVTIKRFALAFMFVKSFVKVFDVFSLLPEGRFDNMPRARESLIKTCIRSTCNLHDLCY